MSNKKTWSSPKLDSNSTYKFVVQSASWDPALDPDSDNWKKEATITIKTLKSTSAEPLDASSAIAETISPVSVASSNVPMENNGTDSLSDQLTFNTTINVAKAGTYDIFAYIYTENSSIITTVLVTKTLEAGDNSVTFNFDGEDIFRSGIDGPYKLGIEVWDDEDEKILSNRDLSTSTALNHTDFEGLSATLTGTYTDKGTDSDQDGKIDKLTINAGVNAARAGSYHLVAYLKDAQGNYASYAVTDAELNAGNNTVALDFNTLNLSIGGQWTVAWIQLSNADSSTVFDEQENVHTTQQYTARQFNNGGVLFTGNNTGKGVDIDNNGVYDLLDFTLGVNVETAGTYYLSATLSDVNNESIHLFNQEVNLIVSNNTLSLRLPGKDIFEGQFNGPFTLTNIQLRNNNLELIAVADSITTEAYSFNDFSSSLQIPENLRSTASAKTTIALDWNDVLGATEYVLQRKTGSGNWEQVYSGSESQFVDQNLTAGTTYSYRVQANSSGFSEEVNVATLSAGVSDVPVIIKSELNTTNKTATLEWTNLGSDYTYYVFRNGALVAQSLANTEYNDSNVPTTTRYLIYAYNTKTGEWTKSLPTVLSNAPVQAEIVSHEVTAQGGIKLNWNIPESNQFIIFRNGIPVSGNVSGQTWTDATPLAVSGGNQYTLYVNYLDSQGYSYWTWSAPYVVQKPTTTSSSASSAAQTSTLDNFWADYDLDLVDDEVLNAVV